MGYSTRSTRHALSIPLDANYNMSLPSDSERYYGLGHLMDAIYARMLEEPPLILHTNASRIWHLTLRRLTP